MLSGTEEHTMDQFQARQMRFLLPFFEDQPFDPTVFNAGDQFATRTALPTYGDLLDSFWSHDEAFRDRKWQGACS